MYKRAQKWMLCGSDDEDMSSDEEENLKVKNWIAEKEKERFFSPYSLPERLPSKIPTKLVVKSIIDFKRANPEKRYKHSSREVLVGYLRHKHSSTSERVCSKLILTRRFIARRYKKLSLKKSK